MFSVFACGEPQTNTPSTAVQQAYSPTWSPDGQRFAFLYKTLGANSSEVHQSIFTALLDGSELARVVELNPPRFEHVFWSPNGNRFVLTTENTQEIFLIASNGFNLQKLTNGELPRWDPSGSKLLYVTDNQCVVPDRVGGQQCSRQIHLYDLDSGSTVVLPLELEKEVIAPAWSADGFKIQWLTVDTEQSKEQSKSNLHFHTFHIGTSEHQKVLVAPIEISINDGNWSPDRTLFTFSYLLKIHTYQFDKKQTAALTDGIEPQIASDNNRILYTRPVNKNFSDIFIYDRLSQTSQDVILHQALPLD